MISIHALHEESDFIGVSQPHDGDISIHALHEESDKQENVFILQLLMLISIHALHEESDHGLVQRLAWSRISIHALHEESDFLHQAVDQHQTYFNPRSP